MNSNRIARRTAESSGARSAKTARKPMPFRPRLEILEQRNVPATITVNSVGDGINPDGDLTLREALSIANGSLDYNALSAAEQALVQPNGLNFQRIYFNIPQGPFTIRPNTPLPIISQETVVDGTSQPGYQTQVPIIELDGSMAGAATNGLTITTSGCAIYGLVINNFAANGIMIQGNQGSTSGNRIAANFVGTDVTGMQARPNKVGIYILDSKNNTVGGSGSSNRNIISGNTQDGVLISSSRTLPPWFPWAAGNKFIGNYIGTNKVGDAKIPNGFDGIEGGSGSDGTIVGGPTDGERNVISGNGRNGVFLFGPGSSLTNNYIGTDKVGLSPLGNAKDGVGVGGDNIVVGAGNVISANARYGVAVFLNTKNAQITKTLIGKDAFGSPFGTKQVEDIKSWGMTPGLRISSNNVGGSSGPSIDIGPTDDVQITDNTISASGGDAIQFVGVTGSEITGNTIENNGGHGVYLVDSSDVLIGGFDPADGNTIANNKSAGISVVDGEGESFGNAILYNSIYQNGELGIDLGDNGMTPNDNGNPPFSWPDLDDGPNHLQNYPEVSPFGNGLLVELWSTPNTPFLFEWFLSPEPDPSEFGEGLTPGDLFEWWTDENGYAVLLVQSVAFGQWFTATATNEVTWDTSEFSKAVQVPWFGGFGMMPIALGGEDGASDGSGSSAGGQGGGTVTVTGLRSRPAGAFNSWAVDASLLLASGHAPAAMPSLTDPPMPTRSASLFDSFLLGDELLA